jgi:hypothetical protein
MLISAAILFLIEIFERRTGWISRLMTRQPIAASAQTNDAIAAGAPRGRLSLFRLSARIRPSTTASKTSGKIPAKSQGKAPAPSTPQLDGGGSATLDAMRKARERASRRGEK